MPAELGTTNVLLGIMAAVSVLEALVIIGISVAGFKAYRKVMLLADGLERQHVAPAMARVNAILDDLKTVTATLQQETERVDDAIHATLGRIHETSERARLNLRSMTGAVVGLVQGLRVAIERLRHPRREIHEM